MKRLVQLPLLTIMGMTLLVSCEKDQSLSIINLCSDEHFYYASTGSKVYLKQSINEIWIVFEQDKVTRESAASMLSKYSFLDMNLMANNCNQVKVRINEHATDCTIANNYLKVLNGDEDIFSATPIFYFDDNDPNSYCILLSEVLAKHNAKLISESDFIAFAETMNLQLVEARYCSQHFKVSEVKTGFEALEISNQIFESGKVQYAQPNCIVKFELQDGRSSQSDLCHNLLN